MAAFRICPRVVAATVWRSWDRHLENLKLMPWALETLHTDFLCGRAGNRVLSPLAELFLKAAWLRHETRAALAQPSPERLSRDRYCAPGPG